MTWQEEEPVASPSFSPRYQYRCIGRDQACRFAAHRSSSGHHQAGPPVPVAADLRGIPCRAIARGTPTESINSYTANFFRGTILPLPANEKVALPILSARWQVTPV
jgi:hypothetical protein